MTQECFRCGATEDLDRFGGSFICQGCAPDSDSNPDECPHDHENPVDVCDVSDDERADMLREYLEAFVDEFGEVPRLMPLDEEGKAPIIQGRASLDSPAGREFLVDGEEAIRQIREDGARGFAMYAGKWDHGTEDAVFVDHDDDAFQAPTAEPTLEVLSGSGRGAHETYRNAGDVQNARVGDNLGEIRAENWYVVTPGSVHPSGGVYHVVEDRDVATLSDDDLDDSMRPASNRRDRDNDTSPSPIEDLDGEGDRPDDDVVDDRLELAFANSHDGDRIKRVWNGRYKAAGFSDRSAAEFWLANRLDSWVARGDETTVRRLMDRANLQKWPERPDDSYRDSVLSEVGYQDWYYDPDGSEEDDDPEYGEERHPLLEDAFEQEADVDGEPTSALPLAQLEALPQHERRRAAKKRGLEWPSTDDAREELLATIKQAMRYEDETVVDAPTSLGKSYSVATTRWGAFEDVTGGQRVVHLSATRDARDEAAAAAEEHGGEHFVLLSRHEACPVAAGDHDPRHCQEDDRQPITINGEPASQWLDRQCEGKGIPFSAAHQYLADHNDQGVALPCGGDGCRGVTQWDDLREGSIHSSSRRTTSRTSPASDSRRTSSSTRSPTTPRTSPRTGSLARSRRTYRPPTRPSRTGSRSSRWSLTTAGVATPPRSATSSRTRWTMSPIGSGTSSTTTPTRWRRRSRGPSFTPRTEGTAAASARRPTSPRGWTRTSAMTTAGTVSG
ncbi:bifunctional DNA primase/polymerase [Halomicroarcula sp. GCM10025709]|uniref:bifunctional DNA primase/polymerase n=1 Tax=Halomicroarcula sp. GCM10025709 TaxID=3252669 RepID=UPI003612DC65